MAWAAPSTFADLGAGRDPAFLNEMRDNLVALNNFGPVPLWVPARKFLATVPTPTFGVVGSAGAETRVPAWTLHTQTLEAVTALIRTPGIFGRPTNLDIYWAPAGTDTTSEDIECHVAGIELGEQVDQNADETNDVGSQETTTPSGVVDQLAVFRGAFGAGAAELQVVVTSAFWRIAIQLTSGTPAPDIYFFGVLIGAS